MVVGQPQRQDLGPGPSGLHPDALSLQSRPASEHQVAVGEVQRGQEAIEDVGSDDPCWKRSIGQLGVLHLISPDDRDGAQLDVADPDRVQDAVVEHDVLSGHERSAPRQCPHTRPLRDVFS